METSEAFSSLRAAVASYDEAEDLRDPDHPVVVPVPVGELVKLLSAFDVAQAALRYMANYKMTGTEQTLHIDFQGKARETLGTGS